MDAPQFEAAKQAVERKSLDQRERMSELERVRHSAAHVMAAAVLRLWPDARIDIGPATAEGFYYDFDLPHRFTPEDLPRIEEEMRRIVKENQPFVKSVKTRGEAAPPLPLPRSSKLQPPTGAAGSSVTAWWKTPNSSRVTG